MQTYKDSGFPDVKVIPPLGEKRTSKSNVRRNDISPLNPRLSSCVVGSKDVNSPFQDQPSLLVSVDWLTLRIEDTLKSLNFGEDGIYQIENTYYRLQLLDRGTPFFKKLCKVFCGNDPIAEIQFDARVAHMGNIALIKYENWVFYEYCFVDTTVGASSAFTGLFAALRTDVLGITRLDICVDGVDFQGFIEDYRLGKYEKLKTRNVSTTYSDSAGGLDYFTVGKRGGKKYARCYRKTNEIKERGNKKQYILDYWQKNGFDLSKEVWRWEIELDSDAIKDMDRFGFSEDIFNADTLIGIINFQIENFFEFVPADSGDSRRSRRQKVQMFNFKPAKQEYVRVKRKLLEGTRTVKIITKRLLRDSYTLGECGTSYANFSVIRDLLEKYCLHNWVKDRQHLIYDDIRKYCLANGVDVGFGSNIYEEIITKSVEFE